MNREDPAKSIDIALVSAVPSELENLTAPGTWEPAGDLLGFPLCRQVRGKLTILSAITGIGKVNAAAATASLLARYRIGMVWHLGSAGAYARGPLGIGDVLLYDPVLCGDEGVLTRQGVLSSEAIGIPLLLRNGEEIYASLSVRGWHALQALLRCTPPGAYRLTEGGRTVQRLEDRPEEREWSPLGGGRDNSTGRFRLVVGPGVTVGMVSGDAEVAERRFERYSAWAEDMEGSAVVQTCMRFQVPVVACRAVSNMAGDRNKANWRLAQSMSHCQALVRTWLDAPGVCNKPFP